jgi:hypothetical protein
LNVAHANLLLAQHWRRTAWFNEQIARSREAEPTLQLPPSLQ